MAIGSPQMGVMRSEVEGGLSGPANPIPEESIDCGCGQLPCPKLARFATRGLFVGLMSCVGIVQAVAQAYMYVTSPTIARRFQFDPYLMDWILVVSEMAPFLLGLGIAYWGDRIHRVAWIGALTMLQGVGYLTMIIPHFSHSVKIIEETDNVTHMSLYADDSPELCSPGLSRVIIEADEPCYITLAIIIAVQLLAGAGNVAYLSLGISYLDDNTKKKHVAAFIGCLLAMKSFGALLGYVLGWGCLRIDADNFHLVESYEEQIGAWWLGWPIIAIFSWIPGLFLALFPRRLPSEVVEQAAASILDLANGSGRSPYRSYNKKFGSVNFFPSLTRLLTNKIIMCNILAAVFTTTAVIHFLGHENIFLESRYHIPRPTGMFLGFGDPWTSRLIANLLKPILVGLVVIVSGLVIAKVRPPARYLAGYNVVVVILAATIFLALAFSTCEKPPIVGEHKGSFILLKYCNKNCRCSRDADFRPVCDQKGMFTFYSPCHAGCSISEYVDDVKRYTGCSCVEEMTGSGNTVAIDGPCRSTSCNIGWLVFQVGSILVTALLASGFIGNLLINLRCIYPQDKALTIGLEITWIALFVWVPGKILYQKIADMTCRYWGSIGTVCHLYDTYKLGDYLCYLTALLLAVATIFDALVWVFSKNLRIYEYPEEHLDVPEEQELTAVQQLPLLNENPGPSGTRLGGGETDQSPSETIPKPEEGPGGQEDLVRKSEEAVQSGSLLKYGPLGPGNMRTGRNVPSFNENQVQDAVNIDTEDDLDSSTDDEKTKTSPKIAYRPLELDSDVESDLGGTGPRSRKNVLSKDFDPVLNMVGIASFPIASNSFPNPDHYEDPKRQTGSPNKVLQSSESISPVQGRLDGNSDSKDDDGFSKTDSFEYSVNQNPSKSDERPSKDQPYRLTGDFNEVGIPIVEPVSPTSPTSPRIKIQSIQRSQSQYKGHESQEALDKIRSIEEIEPENDEDEVPPMPKSPPPHSVASSGFGSLPDVEEKIPVLPAGLISRSRESLDARRPVADNRNRPPPLNTDL